jgi:hypothetical protein
MCAILLGLIVDLQLPGGQSPKKLIWATRALLDFLYLAQLPVHSTETLAHMALCLNDFHDNKQIFIDLGIQEDFNIPKLHGLSHYFPDISLFGTTDNYNTEQFERLHIDLTKDAYHATNHKDEYTQMTVWLERKEKIQCHDAFIKYQLAVTLEVDTAPSIPSNPSAIQPMQGLPKRPLYLHPTIAKRPSKYGVSLDSLTDDYGTSHFADGLADFVIKFNNPELSTRRVQNIASDLLIPFQHCSVFHHLKFRDHNNMIKDTVHAQPAYRDKQGRNIPGRFDTVLVKIKSSSEHSIHRWLIFLTHIRLLIKAIDFCVAQVRAIFKLPPRVAEEFFPSGQGTDSPQHFAYIDWFTPFSAQPLSDSKFYKIWRCYQYHDTPPHCTHDGTVIDVRSIYCSAHLIPQFGRSTPQEWTAFDVMDQCKTFYVNCFTDRHTYISLCPDISGFSYLFETSLQVI